MQSIVSITSQGQVTIPVEIRKALGITGPTKAKIEKKGRKIIIQPKEEFWSLMGFLSSPVKLSDQELREARQRFRQQWPRKLRK